MHEMSTDWFSHGIWSSPVQMTATPPVDLEACGGGGFKSPKVFLARHEGGAEVLHVVGVRLAVDHPASGGKERRRNGGECALRGVIQ